MTYYMPGTAVTQFNVGIPSVHPAVLTSGLYPYVTEGQHVATCNTPPQLGTYNLQSIDTCQSIALSLQIISTNVLNSVKHAPGQVMNWAGMLLRATMIQL